MFRFKDNPTDFDDVFTPLSLTEMQNRPELRKGMLVTDRKSPVYGMCFDIDVSYGASYQYVTVTMLSCGQNQMIFQTSGSNTVARSDTFGVMKYGAIVGDTEEVTIDDVILPDMLGNRLCVDDIVIEAQDFEQIAISKILSIDLSGIRVERLIPTQYSPVVHHNIPDSKHMLKVKNLEDIIVHNMLRLSKNEA